MWLLARKLDLGSAAHRYALRRVRGTPMRWPPRAPRYAC